MDCFYHSLQWYKDFTLKSPHFILSFLGFDSGDLTHPKYKDLCFYVITIASSLWYSLKSVPSQLEHLLHVHFTATENLI